MFDAEEIKKAMEMSEARETIRVEYEDGKVLEHKAKIWTVCGLDPENHEEFSWGKICLVGGDEIVEDAILHMAQLQLVVEEIGSAIVNAVPDLDDDTLEMMLEYCVKKLKKLKKMRKESADA